MNESLLAGLRVLVVEDDYLLADDMRIMVEGAGAIVLGPVSGLDGATALLESDGPADAALLDINLHGEMAFPLADRLKERGIPFVFVTGYDQWTIPERFAGTPVIEKPIKDNAASTVLDMIAAMAQ